MKKVKKLSQSIFPFLIWMPKMTRGTLWADLIAGLTGAVIVLPQGVAFAMIAGLPPVIGLYTAIVTPVIAALFGSSYHLISGPTTAISIVIYSSLSGFAPPGTPEFVELALILTFMAGIIQFALGLARFGTLVNFVSHTVVIAFTSGAGMLIATSQMKHILGIELAGGTNFIETWWTMITKLPEANIYVVIVSLSTLAIGIISRKLLPKIPYLLIAMVAGSALSIAMGGEALGITLVGEIPRSLPPFTMPVPNLDQIRMLMPNAFAVALLGLISAVAIARSIAIQSKQALDGNQEFIGQGLSNIVGSFFSSYAAAGSFTRSGVNYDAGAKTPMAAIFAAAFLLGIVLLVAPLAAYLPIPSMAGVILIVAYNLLDFKSIKKIFNASRSEAAVFVITFGSTIFLQLEFAIYIGIFFSLIFYLRKTSNPRIVTLAPNKEDEGRKFVNVQRFPQDECPQLKVIRIDGSVFFGAVTNIAKVFQELRNGEEKNLLILGDGINMIDVAGGELLEQEAKNRKSEGGKLFLSNLKRRARDFLKKGGYWDEIEAENIFDDKNTAIATIYKQLDPEICQDCKLKIFMECQGMKLKPKPKMVEEIE